ncbi:Cupin domain-containing protein [Pseudarcicella hirudinis]|uniref:Cupin domain-containing protein n=1 Tax=Pseudarcicella hirudinis TaxID=1079859 RepID=A0A1I5XLP0_9BACT|nr:cupin domain-containing protein [Pseudarcicella hirudinis]SFQ32891.1 Cupin domain-containing protein [Pseudarcicella hirudinis]
MKVYIKDQDIAWEELGGGLSRKILAFDANLMMVKVAFEKGGVGTLHSHYHTQMSYVESGSFEIEIGEEKQVLNQGDVYHIPPHLVHGAVCLEKGVLVDVFTPMREDFVK